MKKIKLGFIGLGQRGNGLIETVLKGFSTVDIVAVCDVYEDRVQKQQKIIFESKGVEPRGYRDSNELLKDDEVEAVIISAAWEAHVPLAVAAMKAGKIVGLEVGGAYSIDDCWLLVRTYEETKVPFMFLENCCYGQKELMVTRMARRGVFGEICYCHGAYGHDLRDEIASGNKIRHYRLRNYRIRNCDNYPTHQLGPIAKLLNINRGNRMLTIVTMASKSRGLNEFAREREEFSFLKDEHFAQGDIVQSLIKCADGSLISLKLDTCLPRAYSRELLVSGTKGIFNEQGNVCLTTEKEFNHNKNMQVYMNTADEYAEKYETKLWREITPEEKDAGHGGIDFLMLREFFKAIEQGCEMPIDVYDAAAWMSISCLSEISVAKGGALVEIPDFTSGNWIMREQKDVVRIDE